MKTLQNFPDNKQNRNILKKALQIVTIPLSPMKVSKCRVSEFSISGIIQWSWADTSHFGTWTLTDSPTRTGHVGKNKSQSAGLSPGLRSHAADPKTQAPVARQHSMWCYHFLCIAHVYYMYIPISIHIFVYVRICIHT